MRQFIPLGAACAAAVLPLSASAAIFSDDFETGVSSSKWTLATAGQSMLDGDLGGHHIGNQSAKQVNAVTNGVSDVYYMKTQASAVPNPGTITAGNREIARVQFWDENIQTDTSGDGSIGIGGALMLAGSYGLGDFYQIGVNSAAVTGSTDITNYYIRTALEGNVVTSVARSAGWHELRIEVLPYTGNAGDVLFYIDNTLVNPAGFGKRRPNTGSGFDMNEIRLGLSVRTPDSPFWFDNVSLEVVPEPAAMLLLAPALVLMRRRQGLA